MTGNHDDSDADAEEDADNRATEKDKAIPSSSESLITCIELEAKIASLHDNGTDTTAKTADLRVLLSSLREKHSSIRQIQKRVDDAKCDLLVLREEAEAAKDAALKARSTHTNTDGDLDFDTIDAARLQQSIIEDLRGKIKQLKTEIGTLREQIDAGSGWKPEQEAKKQSLLSSIVRSRNNLHGAQSKLDAMRSSVLGMEQSVRQAEASRDEAVAELRAVTEKVEALNRERETQKHKKKRLENSFADLQNQKSLIENDLAEKNARLQKEKEGLAVSERRLQEDKSILEQFHRKRDALLREIKNLAEKRQRQLEINDEMQNTNAEIRLVAQTKAQELQEIEKDITTMKRQREIVADRTIAAEKDRVQYGAEVERIKLEGEKLEILLLAANKKDASQRRQIAGLQRESAILQRNLHLSQKDTTAYQDLIRTNAIALKTLENESNGIASELCAQRKLISSLEREKEKCEHGIKSAQAQHAEALGELRRQETNIDALRRKAQKANILLKRMQNAYEKVQIESHQSSTQLVEAQEELDRVRRRYHTLEGHISQIEDEIGRTNEALATEHYMHFHADDESSKLKQNIATLHKKISAIELSIRQNDSTIKDLNVTIDTKDDTIARLQKEYCLIMSQRDVTCTHLMRKRDDLARLRLKIQSQQSLMHHGESMIQDQQQQMTKLSVEIKLLAEEKEDLLLQAQQTSKVVERCTKLERELQRERAKKKALQNDLGRPINIHRWRFLEVKDPERYSLLQRVHRLQRRTLDAVGEIAEREALILSKKTTYESAKSNVDRMPTLGTLQHEISEQKQTIKKKKGEIERISAEIVLNREKMASLQTKLGDINTTFRALKMDQSKSGD